MLNNQILASFLKLGHNPRMTSKNTFFSNVMRGFCPSFKNEANIWILDASWFLWHLHFWKSGCYSHNFEKWTRSLTTVFCGYWCPLYGYFLKIWKKIIFCSIFALFSKLLILPYFLSSATKYQSIKIEKTNFLFKVKNGHAEFHKWEIVLRKMAYFWPFF